MLEWYRRVWKRDGDGKRDTQHTYIRKRTKGKAGSTYAYDLEDLFKYSPEWSRDMVVDVESEAATLRRQARYLSLIHIWSTMSAPAFSFRKDSRNRVATIGPTLVDAALR